MDSDNDMDKDGRNLLLYLESCATDFGGLIDSRRMNKEDFETAEEWNQHGFISFGRVCAADICKMKRNGHPCTHWVALSEEAWQMAHQERRARATRVEAKRTWKKTSEDSK